MNTMSKLDFEKNSKPSRLALLGITVAGALALGGCTSLPQSGLIYGSNASFGVGLDIAVAPDPTTKQGFKIHMGYEQSDVAYVPVAVSACLPGSACTEAKLQQISGQNVGKETKPDEGNGATTTATTGNSKTGNKAEDSQLKKDAYSVFGTFAADTSIGGSVGGTTAPNGNGALKVGKVFSTGVASQLLTEGVKGAFIAGAGGNCLANGLKLIDAFKKTDPAPSNADVQTMMKEVSFACTAVAAKAAQQ